MCAGSWLTLALTNPARPLYSIKEENLVQKAPSVHAPSWVIPLITYLATPDHTISFVFTGSNFSRVPAQQRERTFNQTYLLGGKMESIRRAGETTFTVKPDSVQHSLPAFLMSAHMPSLPISSTGSFSTQEETWPANVWMLPAGECDVPTQTEIGVFDVI